MERHDHIDILKILVDVAKANGLRHSGRKTDIAFLPLLALEIDGWTTAVELFEIVDMFQELIDAPKRRITPAHLGHLLGNLKLEKDVRHGCKYNVNICELESGLSKNGFKIYCEFLEEIG